MVMQTAEPASKREANEILVKTLDSTYEKAYLKQVADKATQLDAEEITQLLRLLKYFEDLFDGTLGDWETDHVNLELNPDSKPFKILKHLVPIINKETSRKELKRLVEIGALTPVQ